MKIRIRSTEKVTQDQSTDTYKLYLYQLKTAETRCGDALATKLQEPVLWQRCYLREA